jgi:hypothetical protein
MYCSCGSSYDRNKKYQLVFFSVLYDRHLQLHTCLHNQASDDLIIAVQPLISCWCGAMTVPKSQMPSQQGMTIPYITGPLSS